MNIIELNWIEQTHIYNNMELVVVMWQKVQTHAHGALPQVLKLQAQCSTVFSSPWEKKEKPFREDHRETSITAHHTTGSIGGLPTHD